MSRTHVDEMTALRSGARDECTRRLPSALGIDERHAAAFARSLDYTEARAAYERSRDIETRAKKQWRNLTRALRDGERFLQACTADDGAFTAAALADAIPRVRAILDEAHANAATMGAAAFSEKPPSRRTFIRDRLRIYGGSTLSASAIAVASILAGFWPYTLSDERRFAKRGRYPTAAEVIRDEAEKIRKFVRQAPSPKRAA